MKIKLNTNLVPLFSGTYESIWEVNETDDEGNELEVDYKLQDLLKSIAEAYQDHAKDIQDELGIKFIKKLTFDGTFYSPSEYNFSTDTLDFTIEVNKAELIRTVRTLEGNKELEKFLADHFTSYDGFWSNTPNNYNDLRAEIWGEHSQFEQAIGALITFLGYKPEQDNFHQMEMDVFEDWQGNGYGGLDYQVVESEANND